MLQVFALAERHQYPENMGYSRQFEAIVRAWRPPIAIAVLKPADPPRRNISECIAMLPADSTAVIDPGFAADLEAAIAAHPNRWSRPPGTDPRFFRRRYRRTSGHEPRSL